MLVYQVLRLPWLLFCFALVASQAPQSSICVQSGTICNPPYVPQNGVCVWLNSLPCGNGSTVIVNVFPPAAGGQYPYVPNLTPGQNQPQPCQPGTQITPAQPQPSPNQPGTPYYPAQPQPCPNTPLAPSSPVQPQPSPNQPGTPYYPAQPQPCPNTPLAPSSPVQPQPSPNQPGTPYYPAQPQPCPNTPLAPSSPVQPQPSPNQPGTPYYPAQPQPCPNTPLAPSSPVQPQPSPNQPGTPYYPAQPQPCPNTPLAPSSPVQPQPSPNQPGTPYYPAQPQPCPNTPLAPSSPVEPHPSPGTPQSPVEPQPSPNEPATPFPPEPQPLPTDTVTTSPPVESPPIPSEPVTPNTPEHAESSSTTFPPDEDMTTPSNEPDIPNSSIEIETTAESIIDEEPTTPASATPITTKSPAPAPIIRCPPGTVLSNGSCRLVYCARGVYQNGRCVFPRCPKNTVWTGIKCAAPEPVELEPIYIHQQIVDNASKVLNNKQELVVNASLVLPQRDDDYEDEDEYSDEVTADPEHTSSSRCCTVIAPRICRCEGQSNRWKCYNRRQPLCGDFCNTAKVVLKAPEATSWVDDTDEMLLMPPHAKDPCIDQNNCNKATERYDCSGCAAGLMASCSSYCYNYHCNAPNCGFYDLQKFCSSVEVANSIVCRPENGDTS